MAERWQTSEGRTAAVFLTDDTGVPLTGLACTAVALFKDGTAGAPTAVVGEVGSGFYRVVFTSPPTKDVLVRVDGTAAAGAGRFVPLEVPVGGYPDLVDAATSTRATHAEATGDTAGTSTLLGRLTSGRASLLDALSLLDAAVSTRATHAEATTDTAGTTTLLGRLSSARAALLDLLANVDATVSSRARPSDVNVTVTAAPVFGGSGS